MTQLFIIDQMCQDYRGFAASCCFWSLSNYASQNAKWFTTKLENIERKNTSPNDSIFVEISKFKNGCRDFLANANACKCFTHTNLNRKKQQRKHRHALARVSATCWPTNSMRFPAPIEAPRGNELHLGCYTCWLSQSLETNVHVIWEQYFAVVFLKFWFNKHNDTCSNKKDMETINRQFLTHFQFSLKLQSPTLIPVAWVSSHDDG